MTYRTPVTDADLQAYVDNQLGPNRRQEVEEYLRQHPDRQAQVEDYRRIDQDMHGLFDPVLNEPLPAQLNVPNRGRTRLWRIAATAAWLVLGGMLGWSLHPANVVVSADTPVAEHLVKPAAFAHAVYSSEVRHPVEVTAGEEQHLVSWLSKRLHTEITSPDLRSHGFSLVGGRLLPSTNRMAAQLMYERNDGLRITLYIRQGVWQNTITAFRYAHQQKLGIFYWVDGATGYALSGEIDKAELLRLAEAVYTQLGS